MSSNIIGQSQKKSTAPSEKVAPNKEVEKGIGTLDDIEEPVVMVNNKVIEELEPKASEYSVTPPQKKKQGMV